MTSLRAGDKLDHYLIEKLVARSGMASIFRATDERTSHTVAIKIPHPEMEADPVFYDRFRREQEIGEKLDHPGVMKVFPNDDHSKLIDFGIAANVGSRRLTFAKFSQTMGTPDYISPEQVKGKRGDARSDIYALGVMLYEMLTGKVPFTGPNPFAIMNDRLLNNPIPPREIDPAISPQLQEIMYRAMERDPNKRYPSAREFALDLEHQEHVGVADREELTNWKVRRQPRTRQILFYVAMALIPIVVFGLLLWV